MKIKTYILFVVAFTTVGFLFGTSLSQIYFNRFALRYETYMQASTGVIQTDTEVLNLYQTALDTCMFQGMTSLAKGDYASASGAIIDVTKEMELIKQINYHREQAVKNI